jgi:hypothetical protein
MENNDCSDTESNMSDNETGNSNVCCYVYDLELARQEIKKLVLPNMKSKSMFLYQIELLSNNLKQIEIEVTGRGPIFKLNEAIFYDTTVINLNDYINQIISSNELIMNVKNVNMAINKDGQTNIISIKLSYKSYEGGIIFSNSYVNLEKKGLNDIIDELSKVSKYVTKIVFTSPSKLSSIELVPLCKSIPEQFKSYTYIADSNNKIIIDVNDTSFIDNIKYYSLNLQEELDKIGVVVYGFN